MTTVTPYPEPFSLAEVLRDLETGRSLPLPSGERLAAFGALPRPILGGRDFRLTYASADLLGRVHPRLARPALLRLWLTPWVHPSALRPVLDLADTFTVWSSHLDATTLHGYAGGSGPTAVLVHGWAGRGADWRHLATDLVGAGWRVVVPDLPAHGMSPGRRTDTFELGRAVAAVLEQERPAAVVAHSMGFPATMLALENGAPSPATLVAVAPGRRISHAVAGFVRRSGLRPRLVDELRRAMEQRHGPDVWQVLDVGRFLPFVDTSGLIIHDVDDDEVPLSDARAIAVRWGGATLETTQGLGHRRILRDEVVRARIVRQLS